MNTSTRITVGHYDAMVGRGDFEPREQHHVELIHGEVLTMSPINPPHNAIVAELNEWSFEVLPAKAVTVFVQGAVGIPLLDSAPEPDLVWTRRGDYHARHPSPDDVLLVIEVSDSSLSHDRGLKARLYAEAGLADYWIVNIPDRSIEVRRDPRGSAYQSIEVVRAGQEVRPLAFPALALAVERIFPS